MKTILIIEDDKETRGTYREIFEREGYKILESFSGEEGLKIALENKPDLILLDVMLPGGLNGFDVLEQLKRNELLKYIPVIMLTNLDTEEKVARDIGAVDYLVKANVSMPELLTKINSLLK